MEEKRKIYTTSLMLSVIATAVGSGVMGVMMNSIISTYAVPAAQEGLMSSFISIGALTALIFGISLRGKVPKFQFIIWGGIFMALVMLLKSLPVSFFVFLFLCFGMGFGIGIMDSFQSAFLADLDPKCMAKKLGQLHGIFGVGSFVLPLLLHFLLRYFTWRSIYVILGCICMLLILQFGVMTQKVQKYPDFPRILEKTKNSAQISEFLKTPYFNLLLLCMFLGAAGQNGVVVWTVRYVSVTLGDMVLAPVCLSVFWITTTISRIWVPRLPYHHVRLLAVGSLIAGLAWGIGILSKDSWVMCVSCGAAGLTSGCCNPLLLSEGAAYDSRNTGLITSMLMFVKTVGQILMPMFVSFVQAKTGVMAAMLMVAVVFITDAAVAGMLQRKKRIGVDS